MNKLTIKSKIIISILFCLVLSVISVGAVSLDRYFSAANLTVAAQSTDVTDETTTDDPTTGDEGDTTDDPIDGEDGDITDPPVVESPLTESWESYVNSDDYNGVGASPLGNDNNLSDGIDGPKDLILLGSKTVSSTTTYKLNKDIDLSGKIWSPAGTLHSKVILDGQGYSIIGLTINSTITGPNSNGYGEHVGLFAVASGTVQNLYFKGVNITSPTAVYGGALCGTGAPTIINCGVKGGQIALTRGSDCRVGGFVGEGAAKISYSFVELTLTTNGSSNVTCAGFFTGSGTLKNSYFYGSQTGTCGTRNPLSINGTNTDCYYYSTGGSTPSTPSGTRVYNLATQSITSTVLNSADFKAAWIKDTATTDFTSSSTKTGAMHGDASKDKYILRGVGNNTVKVVVAVPEEVTTKPVWFASSGSLSTVDEKIVPLWPTKAFSVEKSSNDNYTFDTISLSDRGTAVTNGSNRNAFATQKAKAKFKIEFKTTSSTNPYSYNASLFSVYNNRQGDYTLTILMKGMLVEVAIQKDQKASITKMTSGAPSAWTYENAAYVSLSMTNLYTDGNLTAGAKTLGSTSRSVTYFFRYKENVDVTPSKVTGETNAYVKRYHQISTSQSSAITANQNTTITSKITFSDSTKNYTKKQYLNILFDNEHTAKIKNACPNNTSEFQVKVLYGKSFSASYSTDTLRAEYLKIPNNCYMLGYSLVGIYGTVNDSTNPKKLYDYTSTKPNPAGTTANPRYFNGGDSGVQTLSSTTTVWKKTNNSTIYASWMRNQNTILTYVQFKDENGTKQTRTEVLETYLNVVESAQGYSYYTTNSVTGTKRPLTHSSNCQSGYTYYTLGHPKAGYKIVDIEIKNYLTTSGWGSGVTTVSGSGNARTISNLIQNGASIEVTFIIEAEKYTVEIQTWGLDGATQKNVTNPIGKITIGGTQYDLKTEKQSVVMVFNKQYSYTMTYNKGYSYNDLYFGNVGGVNQATDRTATTGKLKITADIDVTKTIVIHVKLSYNEVKYNVTFHNGTVASSGKYNTTLASNTSLATCGYAIDTGSLKFTGSTATQTNGIDSVVDTKTTYSWTGSYSTSAAVSYTTSKIMVFAPDGTLLKEVTSSSTQNCGEYGTFAFTITQTAASISVANYGFDRNAVVRVCIIMGVKTIDDGDFVVKTTRQKADGTYDTTILFDDSIAYSTTLSFNTSSRTYSLKHAFEGTYVNNENYDVYSIETGTLKNFYHAAEIYRAGTKTSDRSFIIKTGAVFEVRYRLKEVPVYVYTAIKTSSTTASIQSNTSKSVVLFNGSTSYMDEVYYQSSYQIKTTVDVGYTFVGFVAFAGKGESTGTLTLPASGYITANPSSQTLTDTKYTGGITYYAIWEAKTYTIVFNYSGTHAPTLVNGGNAATTISGSTTKTLVYNQNPLGDFPIVSFTNSEYDFKGWNYRTATGSYSPFVTYSGSWNADKTLNTTTFSGLDFSGTTINLYVASDPATFNLTYNANGGKWADGKTSKTGTVVYGQNTYTGIASVPTRAGYTLAGFAISGKQYITYDAKGTATYAVWDRQNSKTTHQLDAVWAEVTVPVTYSSGLGKFTDNTTTKTGTVLFGRNNYTNVPAQNALKRDGFTFLYFIYTNSSTGISYYVYPSDSGKTNSNFTDSSKLTGVTFTAVWALSDFGITYDNNPSWIYDGAVHNVTVTPATISNVTYTYAWKVNGTKIEGNRQTLSLRNVSDSGTYSVAITGTYNGTDADPANNTFTKTISFEVEISPRPLMFKQTFNGTVQENNYIVKYFDNKKSITLDAGSIKAGGSIAGQVGIVGGDNISLTAEYYQTKVGTGINVSVNLVGDASVTANYSKPTGVKGSILALPILFYVNGSTLQIGAETNKITVPYTIKTSVSGFNVLAFLSENNITISTKITTNCNKVGEYTHQNDGTYLMLGDVNVVGTEAANFTFALDATSLYKIEQAVNSIRFTVNVLCDDTTGINPATIGIVTVASNSYELVAENSTAQVSFLGSKDFYKTHSTVGISLSIKNANYWVKSWSATIDGKADNRNLGTANTLNYAIVSTTADSIVINVHVTTLVNVDFAFGLATGETISYPTTSTLYAYQKSISESISTYKAVLPSQTDMLRAGWTFTGWTLSTGAAVTTSTIWPYKGNDRITLYANWELNAPVISKKTSAINKVYDATASTISYEISNHNAFIDYTYAWEFKATGTTSFVSITTEGLSYSVLNVKDSGQYRVTVTATLGKYTKSAVSEVINVNITPYIVFNTNIQVLNKEYDGTNKLIEQEVKGPKSEIVYVIGEYNGIVVGSLINKASLKLRSDNADVTNYQINKDNVSAQSQIVKREVVVDIGTISTPYTGKVYTVKGTYTDPELNKNFAYEFATISKNVGKYDDISEFTVVKFGTDAQKPNFSITIKGSVTIVPYAVTDIVWTGETNVIFDGATHALDIASAYKADLNVTIIYKSGSEETEDAPRNAGIYTVVAEFEPTANITVEGTVQTTLTITKRTIYLEPSSLDKVYDGQTAVVPSTLKIYADTSKTLIQDKITDYVAITVLFNYTDKNAQADKTVNATLDAKNAENANYEISTTTRLKGTISKKGIILTTVAGVSKQYNGEPFTVNADQIVVSSYNGTNKTDTGNGLVASETLGGNIVFVNIINAGTYDINNATYKTYTNSLTANGEPLTKNYEIANSFAHTTAGSNTLVVEKAEIDVLSEEAKQYVYTGTNVKLVYTFVRTDGTAVLPTDITFTYTNVDAGEKLDAAPIYVGNYKAMPIVQAADSANFKITNTVPFSFSIVQRDISFFISETKTYDGEVAKYVLDDSYIAEGSYKFAEGDTSKVTIQTVDCVARTYNAADSSQTTLTVVVKKGELDVTDNYRITSVTGQIVIAKREIEFSKINIGTKEYVYDAQTKTLKAEIKIDGIEETNLVVFGGSVEYGEIYSVARKTTIDGTEMSVTINDPSEVLYAGEYYYRARFVNFVIINDDYFKVTITPKEIKDITLSDNNKQYDSTRDFVGTITTSDIYDVDKTNVIIKGVYATSNVANNQQISFELFATNGDIYLKNSYKLALSGSFTGNITPKQIELVLTTTSVNYTNQIVVLPIELFTVTPGMVNSEYFLGEVKVELYNAGTYELADHQDKIKPELKLYDMFGNELSIGNYVITKISGQLSIAKTNLVVTLSELTHTYDATAKAAKYEISLQAEGVGEIVFNQGLGDFVTLSYKDASGKILTKPVEAGIYTVIVTFNEKYAGNYGFVNEKNELLPTGVYSYESVYEFVINKRQISIVVEASPITFEHTGNPATYTIKLTDVIDPTADTTGGILNIHTITGILKTNDVIAKTYSVYQQTDLTGADIIAEGVKILAGETDVSANYNIEYYTAQFVIGSMIGEIGEDGLEGKVYNTENQVHDIFATVVFDGETIQAKYSENNAENAKIYLSDLKVLVGSEYVSANHNATNAGSYSVTLKVGTGENVLNFTEKVLYFVIAQKEINTIVGDLDKQYDKTSDVPTLTSPDIFAVDVPYVTVVGTYMKDAENPAVDAGTYNIKLSLIGSKKDNYIITAGQKTGTIAKREVTLVSANIVTYYTGANVVLDIKQFTAKDNAGIEITPYISKLEGSVIINVIEVGKYDLAALFDEIIFDVIETKLAEETSLFDNYIVIAYNASLEVKPCEITITTTKNEFIYNGAEQAIEYTFAVYNNHGALSEELSKQVISVKYNGTTALPVMANEYSVSYSIADDYQASYIIVNAEGTKVPSVSETMIVARRHISVRLSDVYIGVYTLEPAVYTLVDSDIVDPTGGEGGLVASHSVVGTLTTNGSDIGTYKLENTPATANFANEQITPVLAIMASGEDVTVNYLVETYTATIKIDRAIAGEINQEHLDSLVYTGVDYVASGDIYLYLGINNRDVRFELGKTNDFGGTLAGLTEARDAGEYVVYLQLPEAVLGAEYTNKAITFTIAQRQIKTINFINDKQYDGTADVVGEITSPEILIGDDAVITATYQKEGVDIAVAGADYTINFVVNGDDAHNYIIVLETQYGSIFAREIILNLNKNESTYYTGEKISFAISKFNAVDTEGIARKEFTDGVNGNIIIDITKVGTYSLDTIFEQITAELENIGVDVLANYSIVGYAGVVTIEKSQIKVVVSDTQKVYNGEAQPATVVASLFTPTGKISNEELATVVAVTYRNQAGEVVIDPTDFGTYSITLSIASLFADKYAIVDEDNKVQNHYVCSQSLVIEKRIIAIEMQEMAIYNYDGQVKTYTLQNTDVIDAGNGGLVEGQNIVGTFKTNYAFGGRIYTITNCTLTTDFTKEDITPTISAITNAAGTNVISNYEITTLTGSIRIKNVLTGEINTTVLNELVYDTKDKVVEEKIQVSFVLNGKTVVLVYGKPQEEGNTKLYDLEYKDKDGIYQPTTTAINSGDYKVKLSIYEIDEYQGYEITFTIAKKQITSVLFDGEVKAEKIYDATPTVTNTITSNDVYAGDDVTFSAIYTSNGAEVSNVGTYDLAVQFAGDDAFNYELNLTEAKGDITQRAITISVKTGFNLTYNGESQQISSDNLVVSGLGLVEDETLTGYILVIPTAFGTYELNDTNINIENLLVQKLNLDNSTANYAITLAGTVDIVAAVATISFSEIDLTYNGEIQSITEYVVITGISDLIIDEAYASVVITYDETPLNAGNYTATITSSSKNFTFDGETTKTFTIKKKDFNINIGEQVVVFNPLKDHQANLDATLAEGIVNGQTVSGTYKLNAVGKNVGVYTVASGEVVIENVDIKLNGVSIMSNYNYVVENNAGQIEVIPFELRADQVYLVETLFTYNRTDITDVLVVKFFDANNELQTITETETTLGSFALTGGLTEALNAGTYSIKVTIPNYALANDILTFDIEQKEIRNVRYLAKKTYDGTSHVVNSMGSNELTSTDVISGDDVIIVGVYMLGGNPTANVGENLEIVFEIKDSENFPAANYKLNISAKGSITWQELIIEVTPNNVIYTPEGIYEIEYSETIFKVVYGYLVTGDKLSGKIVVEKPDFDGEVDLSMVAVDQLKVLNGSEEDVTANYSITVEGTLVIEKAQISLDFSEYETQYTYNNQVVEIVPVVTVSNGLNDVTLNVQYVGQNTGNHNAMPQKNVDKYRVTFTIENPHYEFVTDNFFEYEIVVCEIVIAEGTIEKGYFNKEHGQADPAEFVYQITSDYEEVINIVLTREAGEKAGYYDMYIDSWDNQNYAVSFAENAGNDLFRILKAGNVNVTILDTENNRNLLTKVYDNTPIGSIDISTLDYTTEPLAENGESEVIVGTITFQAGVNVGEYTYESFELETDNYDGFTLLMQLTFKITPTQITIGTDDGFVKEFDGNANYNGEIKIYDTNGDVLNATVFPLTATATYAQIEVGTGIAMDITFADDLETNYALSGTYTGEITKRAVTVTPTSGQNSVYGDAINEITYSVTDNGTSSFTGAIDSFLTVSLTIEYKAGQNKYVAGEYLITGEIVSDNLDVTLVDNVVYTVTPKQIEVVSNDGFDKIYDTTADVINDISLEGVIAGDIVTVSGQYYTDDKSQPSATVGSNKVIVWTLAGADKDNYAVADGLGNITEKLVVLNYVYITDVNMINSELIENNSVESSELIYGAEVSTTGNLPEPSHEGYEFAGWYLDEGFTTQITDSTVIESPLWEITEESKTAYAKWTIKRFKLTIISATRIDGVYTTEGTQGGVIATIAADYEYYTVVSLADVCTANEGYEFVGFADALNGEAIEEYLTEGVRIEAEDKEIYAKFKPLTPTITVYSEGGLFTRCEGWEFNNSNNVAQMTVEYNKTFGDFSAFPEVTLSGYKFVMWVDEFGNEFDVSADRVIDFYKDIELFAKYEALDFYVILSAAEGYYQGFDEEVWTVVESDAEGRAIVVEKIVKYDSLVGELLTPVRDGYTFAEYDNLEITPETVWTFFENKTLTALWVENIYTIVVSAEHGTIDAKVYNSLDEQVSLVDVTPTVQVDENGNTIITLKTTYRAEITVTASQGYLFSAWTSNVDDYNNVTTEQIVVNGLEKYDNTIEIELVATFAPDDNDITVVVNNPLYGYVSSGEFSTIENGQFVITAKTETEVTFNVVAAEGYELDYWKVDAGSFSCVLSGTDKDLERTLSGFISDVTITVYFTPKTNQITILADADKGYFNIDGEIEGANSYVASIKTEQTLVFDVHSAHGYVVDTNLDSWKFETVSEQKGTFSLEEKDGYVTVSFSGFINDGQITIPFLKANFTIQVVAVLKDDNAQIIDTSATEIVELNDEGNLIVLDSNGTFEKQYLSQVVLTPKDSIKGYKFYAWSSMADKTKQLITSEGNVGLSPDGVLTLQITGTITTIYVVYTINTYRVTFKTNDALKGLVGIGGIVNPTINDDVKYLGSSQVIKAVPNENYEFVHWINEETGEVYSTDIAIQIKNVEKDETYVAVFKGLDVVIQINVVLLEEDVFEEGEIDFASLNITENENTILKDVSRTDTMMVYTINSLTGETIHVDFLASYGYELDSLLTDPRYMTTEEDGHIVFSNINASSIVTIRVKAQIYDVSIKLTGKTQGANIYYDARNGKGILSHSATDKDITFRVKYGGDVSSIIYTFTGYSIIDNEYFEKSQPSDVQLSEIYEYAVGGVKNVTQELNITVEIVSLRYQVTFKYNYGEGVDGQPEDFVAVVEYGESTFVPVLPTGVTAPDRQKYNFLNWNTIANGDGRQYYFDEVGRMYSMEIDGDGIESKVYGFVGGADDVVYTGTEDYDFTSVLYADWELETYRIDVVFVPGNAVNTSNLNYAELFPQHEGLHPDMGDGNVFKGVRYVPGSTVVINAPEALAGYTYFGWSYEGNLTNKALFTTEQKGQYIQTMGEEDIVVYLYYTFKVGVGVVGGGDVSVSATDVLFNETIIISANPHEGYLFTTWLDGTNEIANAQPTMELIATGATTYVAVFTGMVVDVRIKTTEFAGAKVASTTGEAGVYRVGDTITLAVENLRYGYNHIGWEGANLGVTGNEYKLSAQDYNRKDNAGKAYVEFIPKTQAKKVNVQFVVEGGIGGVFVFNEQEIIDITYTYDYDKSLTFDIRTSPRYALVSLTLNGNAIDLATTSMVINQALGFTAEDKNVVKAVFAQVLWIDSRIEFTGLGTEQSPYLITNANQLAQMAYLINNNIDANGLVAYADAYYRVKGNIQLSEKFWIPIGTEKNPFNGTFEILDYRIDGVYLDKEYAVTNYGGVFGYLGPNARIIEGNGNYQATIIIVSVVGGVLVIVFVVIILYIYAKKNRYKKLASTTSKIADLIPEDNDSDQE